MSISSHSQMVDAASAVKMLSNRKDKQVKRKSVIRLVRDLHMGKFPCNDLPVVIDENGLLVDGITRLMAIVEANIPALMVIKTGVAAR